MKRWIALLTAAALIAALTVSAAGAVDDDLNPVGKTVISDGTWNYEKVTGYGFEIESYLGDAAAVSIPYSYAKTVVGSVGEHAFDGNTTVTSVTLTENTRRLGKYAFSGCSALERAALTGSLESIGVGCFYGTSALKEVNLADSAVTAVPAYCFAESGVERLALPETCTAIGNMAFYRCAQLSRLLIPDSVTKINETAFTDCEDLVIYCNADSYAHEFAVSQDIDCVLLDVPSDVTFVLGDADGDGFITILDATKIQRVLAALTPDADGMIALRGDADGMGLDILDATRIQRFLAGFTTELAVGEEVTKSINISF